MPISIDQLVTLPVFSSVTSRTDRKAFCGISTSPWLTNAPLDVVVADLSRYTGKGVSVDPRLRNRKFSGVLAIANGPGMFRDLAELMSISSRPDGAGVRFVPVGER